MNNRPNDPQDGFVQEATDEPVAGQDEPWPEGEEQLTLAAEDERLPWLESDEDYEDGGFDMGRLVTAGVIGLLVVLALLGAVWWLSQAGPDEELLAEGSTIEAPDEPFRTRPDDPGGLEVAGTGDVSFEVGEGQSREAVLREDGPVPGPGIDREQNSSAEADANPVAQAASAADGVGVQVAAYTSRARAEQGWRDLSGRYDALQGQSYRVVQASVDGATVYRLQVVADSQAGADSLCRALRAAGGDCQVVR